MKLTIRACGCEFYTREVGEREWAAKVAAKGGWTDEGRIYVGGIDVARSPDGDPVLTITEQVRPQTRTDIEGFGSMIRAWHDAGPGRCLGARVFSRVTS